MEITNEQQGCPFLQKIPCEVITDILQRCIPAFDDYEFTTTDADVVEALRLGAICRPLRQLVYSTPALWATVTFRLKPSDSFDYISEWLGRAGSTPLALRVDTYWVLKGSKRLWFGNDDEDKDDNDEDDDDENIYEDDGDDDWEDEDDGDDASNVRIPANVKRKRAQISTLLSTIRPYLSKCAHLDLRLPYIVPELMLDPPSKFPLLKTLALDVEDEFMPRHPFGLVKSPDVVPNIGEVRIKGLPLRFMTMPWNSIVDLELAYPLISECALVVSQIPMLRRLVVIRARHRHIDDRYDSDWGSDEDDDDDTTPSRGVSLPHLVALDWQSDVHPRISRLFDKLRTPSLTYFRYYPSMPWIGYSLRIFVPFLQQATLSLSVIIVKNLLRDGLQLFRSTVPNATLIPINDIMPTLERPPRLDSSILSLYDNPTGGEGKRDQRSIAGPVNEMVLQNG